MLTTNTLFNSLAHYKHHVLGPGTLAAEQNIDRADTCRCPLKTLAVTLMLTLKTMRLCQPKRIELGHHQGTAQLTESMQSCPAQWQSPPPPPLPLHPQQHREEGERLVARPQLGNGLRAAWAAVGLAGICNCQSLHTHVAL